MPSKGQGRCHAKNTNKFAVLLRFRPEQSSGRDLRRVKNARLLCAAVIFKGVSRGSTVREADTDAGRKPSRLVIASILGALNGRAGGSTRIGLHQGAMRDGPARRASPALHADSDRNSSHALTLKHDDPRNTREKARHAAVGAPSYRDRRRPLRAVSHGNVHGLPTLGILRTESAPSGPHDRRSNPPPRPMLEISCPAIPATAQASCRSRDAVRGEHPPFQVILRGFLEAFTHLRPRIGDRLKCLSV
jgi:hypothetical protein